MSPLGWVFPIGGHKIVAGVFLPEGQRSRLSQSRSVVDVRLQSAPCGVPTRKGRRQARNASVQQLAHVAVCLLPGTEVAFEKEIEFERGFTILLSLRWEREKAIGDKVARFRQVNADKPNVHHDALEFPNGEIVLVTRLYEGQHATVLQL